MDEFDIIDLVYARIVSADTGMQVVKHRSAEGINVNHIVISHLKFEEDDFENHLPVNVNIFVRNHINGMPNVSIMKETKRKVREELLNINNMNNGQYRHIEIEGSQPFPGAKKGFYCVNIQIKLKTDK